MRLDASGKVSLDHIYTAPDPRTYFQALRPLGYQVPQLAKPWFDKILKEYRETEHVAVPHVLDIGCSYGINAALLKYDTTMDELYARYDGSGPASRAGLLERDRDLAHSRRPAHPLRFTGLDASAPALAYAHEAGFLDATVNADLESNDPTPAQRDLLAGADLVISTGCVGYVTERTLTRVVRAQDGRLPWMAHFVLRMFPFDPMEKALAELGYRTVRVDGVFRQRRFAGPQEQRGVLDGMAAAGLDASGLEEDGWLYAQLHLSRPQHP
ncbi:class I SAM-dependent methyltransferase [Streptomyces sp. NPDC053741]|uniref:Class I SAM-dependent methyltransferase n=1 Tax=Streptomyces pratensis (strain ATCC 33331 / IAF-45CD) TaxID=591167 RepID=A0A8D4BIA2_STRFA|nr:MULTISPECIES: class I SAM-dependent methyltransferase [Streptomyces]RAS36801.1 carnitine O-acetyltransferase [Streptomyces avidinii]SNX73032.1 carnitine O-acetyltransferase [Streptomyces microflavus]MCY1651172.1 class I SAM-dependent methyltransferase [Streptomyces sp. SL203]MCY1681664.1 class I SAM-dependent methyltransferase [Streptomyces sp. SL294]MDF0372714.1 class I SAM-dependent methyltransferase [Streptomyces sp. KA12]